MGVGVSVLAKRFVLGKSFQSVSLLANTEENIEQDIPEANMALIILRR